MSIALSVVHIYNGAVTPGGTDGDLVAETATGSNQILLELNRGTVSSVVTLAIRATTATCYFVRVFTNDSDILLSVDSVNWGASVFFLSVGSVNNLFYVKSISGEDEDYGDTIRSIQVGYYAPT